MTIYMISYGEDMINEEYGYFSSEESAERYVRNLDAEKLSRYRDAIKTYEAKLKRWQRKTDKANKLGFSNPDWRPSPPLEPTWNEVVPVQPNEEI